MVHCERVASVKTPSISRAAGCWLLVTSSIHKIQIQWKQRELLHVHREMPSQAVITTRFHPPHLLGIALEDGELVRRQLGLTAAAVCITCRCLCSVPCLQSAVCWLLAWLETVSPGAAAHPSAEISSAVRTLSPHVATLVPRGHTRDTWPGKKICTHCKFCLTSRFPKTEFGAGSVGARGRCRGVSQPPVTASCKL